MIYHVRGGRKLEGSVKIGGSKNAVLPILFATLLTRGKSILSGVPEITDVDAVLSLLRAFGADVRRVAPDTLEIDTNNLSYASPCEKITRQIRASTYLIGACLGRFGRVEISAFGGCSFCERPIDLHLQAVRAFGGEISENEILCKQLFANRVIFPIVSVGATVNGLLLASQIEDDSVLENVAIEPHVLALVAFLRIAGCRISVLHTPRPTFFVRGGRLQGVKMRVIPDMIEAGTYLISALVTGGRVTVEDIDPAHLGALFSLLKKMGADLVIKEHSATVISCAKPYPPHAICAPYPALPTDLSPILAAMLARYGMGTLCDTVFPKRRSFLAPYHALGVNFAQLDDGTISFSPADAPRADCISVPDLRTGAGAVLYALSLNNDITVYDTQDFILRGYEYFTKKLNALGACICDETHINRKE